MDNIRDFIKTSYPNILELEEELINLVIEATKQHTDMNLDIVSPRYYSSTTFVLKNFYPKLYELSDEEIGDMMYIYYLRTVK